MKTPAQGTGRGVYVGGRGMAANVVREALHTFAKPDVAVRIITRALHLAQEMNIPAGGKRLRVFVDHHLFASTKFVLDEQTADALLLQLRPLLSRIPSVEPEEPSAASRMLDEAAAGPSVELPDLPPASEDLSGLQRATHPAPVDRAVLVASRDPNLLADLEQSLDATVVLVEDIVTMLDAVAMAISPPVVVVDCAHPAVQPTTLATMGEDLPAGAEVVLWGPDPVDEQSARSLVQAPDRWYSCESELPPLLGLLKRLLHIE